MLQRIFFFFLFCSTFMYALHEEFTYCKSSYEYNDVGDVVGLKVRMQRTTIPVVDGMRMEWQRQEHVVEKTFSIHNQMKIAEHENFACEQK